jgi:glycosyltransferase involved in cell wall biosynthesis
LRNVFFDLTEVFTFSSRFRYYGIARVVAELALALSQIGSGVRYVVHSPAEHGFVEVYPKFEDEASGFVVDLGVAHNARPLRVRKTFHSPHQLLKPVLAGFGLVVQLINNLRWMRLGFKPHLVDLRNATLVAAGRPKIIVEYLNDLVKAQPACRLVVLLHDMIPIHHATSIADVMEQRRFVRNFYHDNCAIIRVAGKLLANSEFTKSDIERLYSLGILPPLPPIVTIPLAHECRGSSERIERALPNPGYFLCVGSTLGRKNIEVVFDALRLCNASGQKIPRLVLAGTSRKRIVNFLAKDIFEPVRDVIDFVPNPNQAELVTLYKNAKALIIPSKLEGWGLPAGEALWCGTPVICADIPVFHEVCGESAIYFSPNSAQSLFKVLSEQDFAVKANTQNLRDWKAVARQLLSASLDS